jgi:hypothetical protein
MRRNSPRSLRGSDSRRFSSSAASMRGLVTMGNFIPTTIFSGFRRRERSCDRRGVLALGQVREGVAFDLNGQYPLGVA